MRFPAAPPPTPPRCQSIPVDPPLSARVNPLQKGVWLFSFALLVTLSSPLAAFEPLSLFPSTTEANLFQATRYLEDPGNALTIESASNSADWKDTTAESFNFGFSKSAYWFRIAINSTADSSLDSFLELNYPMLDRVDCYFPDGNGSYSVLRSGDMLPFDQRDVRDRNILFKVPIRPGQNTIYIRVASTSSINFVLSLLSYDGYISKVKQELPIFWMYYGIMIVMFIYNLLIFVIVRNQNYFYYVLFVLAFALFQFTLNGFSFQYLWPDLVWWANNCLPIIIALTAAATGTILRTFMQTKQNYPVTDRIAFFTIVAPGLVWAIASFFIPYMIAIKGSTLIALAGSLIMILLSIGMVIRGSRDARFFLLSWMTMLIGIVVYTLKTFGLAPATFLTNWGVQIGSSATVVLLSGALAQNINVMRRTMLDLNASLKSSESLARDRAVHLERVVTTIKEISGLLLSVSLDLSEMGQTLSRLSAEQSSTSGHMSSNFEEIKRAYERLYQSIVNQKDEGEKTRQFSRNLQKSQESITADIMTAAEGVQVLARTNNESETALKNMIEKMGAINDGGKSIENFMDIINDITSRINLLSLNAAIEAARAGEHGRGFAVVADEIGKLASATSENAKQISGRISAITKDITSGTALMNNTKAQLEQTFAMINVISARTDEVRQLVRGQDEGINQIVSQAGVMEDLSRNIEEATGKQSQSLSATLAAIARMNEIAAEVSRAEQRILDFTDLIQKNSTQLNELIRDV